VRAAEYAVRRTQYEMRSTALHRTFDGLTVLVTGHTGFKGSWLSIWLHELGARVVGYSLDPPTEPSNFVLSHLAGKLVDLREDVRDYGQLRQAVEQYRPSVVFHLAAQPLVLLSYREPKETLDVNVGGTVNVLEVARTTDAIRAVVCVTTDKVYRNRNWTWGYRENDELGGHDPYSASKAMAELAVASYSEAFFSGGSSAERGVAVASARAGNVLGGGDWGHDRLVPDCVRALIDRRPIPLHKPSCVRPWQSVFEPLSGYLWLAAKLLSDEGSRYAGAWNFGPPERRAVTTEELVCAAIDLWGDGSYAVTGGRDEVETSVLRLNWDKAANQLGWWPVYDWKEALAETIAWFKTFHAQCGRGAAIDMYGTCVAQIAAYSERASEQNLAWAR
jgi:CDP-glucose 4,6-dehydratase